jgi:ubiquitin C-terminal hydrolase
MQTFQSRVSVGRRGNVGICNLGNSCYMSSSLQCLSHIVPITSHFVSTAYLQTLNTTSLDGTGGKLALEYCSALKSLWFENKSMCVPSALKRALGKVRAEYAGFQQHDAHELVELMLDKVCDILCVVDSGLEWCRGVNSSSQTSGFLLRMSADDFRMLDWLDFALVV